MATCGSCKHFDEEKFPYNEPCKYCGNDRWDCNGYYEGVIYYEQKHIDLKSKQS